MKFIMKKNMTALAMSVAMATGAMGYMATAQAAEVSTSGTANYSATLNITSDVRCELAVTSPTTTTFNATWTAKDTSGTFGSTLDTAASPAEPPEITVGVSGGGSCNIAGLQIITTSEGSEPLTGKTYSFLKQVTGADGAYWRFVPTMSKITLFTNAAATSGSTTDVSFTAPDGTEHAMAATAQAARGAQVADWEGATGKFMTANYLGADYKTALMTNGNNVSGIKPGDASVDYKAAKLGIGVLVSNDPETQAGTPAMHTVQTGDSADIPFVVAVNLP